MSEATRHIACVIEWLKRPDWGQYQYMEGSEIYTHREDALIDLNCATAAIEAAEAAAFRRGVEAMRKAAVEEMNRLYFAEAEPTQQAYDRQDAFHCADRAIAALPPPENEP